MQHEIKFAIKFTDTHIGKVVSIATPRSPSPLSAGEIGSNLLTERKFLRTVAQKRPLLKPQLIILFMTLKVNVFKAWLDYECSFNEER